MAYKFKPIEKIVGSFVAFAALLLAASLILVARGKNLFEKKAYYHTFFRSGDGLSRGMPVVYNGIRIGQVSEVLLTPDNRVYVNFYVLAEHTERVREDSVAVFSKPALGLGQSTLRITIGSPKSRVLEPGSYIHSSDSEAGLAILNRQRGPAEGPERILANVEEITRNLRDPSGPLMSALADLAATTAQVRRATQDLDRTLANIRSITSNLDTVTATVASNRDRIGRILLSTERATEDLAGLAKNLRHNRLLGGRPAPHAETPAQSP